YLPHMSTTLLAPLNPHSMETSHGMGTTMMMSGQRRAVWAVWAVLVWVQWVVVWHNNMSIRVQPQTSWIRNWDWTQTWMGKVTCRTWTWWSRQWRWGMGGRRSWRRYWS
ncbi:hypothetical protein HDU93_009508, partial [Gonapodya sp. JEL0774]